MAPTTRFTVRSLVGTVLLALCLAVPAGAADVTLFPEGHLYRPYMASPHSPGFALVGMAVDEGIPESGSPRFLLRVGGRFGLLRWTSGNRGADGDPEWNAQLELEAGIKGQFDGEHSLDNIGWDGNYGLVLTGRWNERWGWKVGSFHTSAHVGDEYIERTGRRRIGYTREEAVLGLSWTPGLRWRFYAEGGWGYDLRSDEEGLQEPGRLELGAEYLGPNRLLGGRAAWFSALDLSFFEESDRGTDAALQAGLAVPLRDRVWRLGVLAYDGRVPLGEFSQSEETYLGIGVWLDL